MAQFNNNMHAQVADERGFYVTRDLDYSREPTEAQVELVRRRLHDGSAESTQNDLQNELQKNFLDLYLPLTAGDGVAPVVVFVHGGGWRRGDKAAWNHFLSLYDTNFLLFSIMWLCNLYG